jgi:hypothetical protein
MGHPPNLDQRHHGDENQLYGLRQFFQTILSCVVQMGSKLDFRILRVKFENKLTNHLWVELPTVSEAKGS